jgi:hypothetical protein
MSVSGSLQARPDASSDRLTVTIVQFVVVDDLLVIPLLSATNLLPFKRSLKVKFVFDLNEVGG